jgi:hypothetical protein
MVWSIKIFKKLFFNGFVIINYRKNDTLTLKNSKITLKRNLFLTLQCRCQTVKNWMKINFFTFKYFIYYRHFCSFKFSLNLWKIFSIVKFILKNSKITLKSNKITLKNSKNTLKKSTKFESKNYLRRTKWRIMCKMTQFDTQRTQSIFDLLTQDFSICSKFSKIPNCVNNLECLLSIQPSPKWNHEFRSTFCFWLFQNYLQSQIFYLVLNLSSI